jgi:hypothetical protein
MKQRRSRILSNTLSLIGLFIAVLNIGLIVFLSIVEALSARAHPYADLVVWIVLPAIVLFGVVLIIVGTRRQRRKELAGGTAERRFLVIDFNDPKHRKRGLVLLMALLLLSLLYAFSGYKAYEFSESKTFCGIMCHRVMGPESRSHDFSVHAMISCTDCHVGPGAKYFFSSHLKGTRQAIHLLLNRYSKPIPTPVADLRPSQDVCENCHGPKYEVNQRLQSRTYFLSDKENSRRTINLLLRMGKADVTMARPPKMHWHSSTTEEIVYSVTDPKRVDIPWIRVKRLDGKVRVYRSVGSKLSDDEVAKAGTRRMDCVDCHNRSGHPTNPPAHILNAMLAGGLVDPALPEIKIVAIQALEARYASREEARKGIDMAIRDFYRKAYPAVAKDKEAAIAAASKALQGAYDRNYDPHMQVSWRNFSNNQNHLFAPGCFRCHDGKHRSEDGTVLSRDCSLCHLLIERVSGQGSAGREQAVFRVMQYPHPVEIGDLWKERLCHECHGSSS